MRCISWRTLAVALLGVALGPLVLRAQDRKTEKECEKAAKIIDKGHPAHKQTVALTVLLGCGSTGATATAAAIHDSRSEGDTIILAQLTQALAQLKSAPAVPASVRNAAGCTRF